jgi:FlaA1/EpsC-like NDP-sugar epimerase
MPAPALLDRASRIAIQAALVVASSWLAWWIADGRPPAGASIDRWIGILPLLVPVRALALAPFGLYAGLWRYADVRELAAIAAATGTGSVVLAAFAAPPVAAIDLPPRFLVIDSLVLAVLLSAVRLARRLPVGRSRRRDRRRVLVYGAGDAGEMILRDMQRRADSPYEAVGLIDDDPAKLGLRIHGVRVVGGRDRLAAAMAALAPDEVLLAMPSASLAALRVIVDALQPYRVPIKTLPSLRELPVCHVEIAQIRELALEDLLTRPVVGLAEGPVRALVEGRRVLVTGAGGSIGSELCRQILRWRPASLVLVERHENALFWLARELQARAPGAPLVPALADVTDAARIARLFAAERPDIVFHAAAHKHVPMLEDHPCEAVRNNVFGTLTVARAAERCGTDRFVLISTDKAVSPASVMGATKRMAELIVQVLMRESPTRCAAVRFGNVLGSSGSVVQVWLRQIKAGGPVTVTDPGMRRYFMLIAEAVELVQQAAALAEPGTVYALEMGEPIPVVDLARRLIRLAGYRPDTDVPIVFTGARPGERLEERLVGPDESVGEAPARGLMVVRPHDLPPPDLLEARLAVLDRLVRSGHDGATREALMQMAGAAPAPGVIRVPEPA